MTLRANVVGLSMVGLAVIAWPGVPAAGAGQDARPGESAAELSPELRAFVGRWTVNRELSDDVQKKLQEAQAGRRGGGMGPGGGGMGPGGGGMGPGGGGMGPGGGMGRRGGAGGRGGMGGRGDQGPDQGRRNPGGGALATLATYALEVVPDGTELILIQHYATRDGEQDDRSQRIDPSGRKVKQDGGASETQARLKDGKLTIDTKGDFSSTRQTYTLLPGEPRRLEVITKVQSSGPMGSGNTIEVKRVFDPDTGDEPAPGPSRPPGQ